MVPHSNVRKWERKPIRGSAFRRDLYTTLEGGRETDAIERWLTSEIEQPGQEASERLLAGRRLTRDDWRALIRLYALQEVRTPLSFTEFISRWDAYLPDLIEKSLKEAVRVISLKKAAGSPIETQRKDYEFSRLLKVSVQESTGDGNARLGATVTAGRSLWMYAIRHLMQGRAMDKLLSHE